MGGNFEIERLERFKIRLIQETDLMDVFNLSNDPVVRANSFNSKSISLDAHIKWFNEKIKCKDSVFYIIRSYKDELVAQVRFDVNPKEKDTYLINISLSANYRGKGLASKILNDSSNKLIREFKAKKIIAYIKPINIASKKSFLKAGYVLVGKEVINGLEAFKFEYSD